MGSSIVSIRFLQDGEIIFSTLVGNVGITTNSSDIIRYFSTETTSGVNSWEDRILVDGGTVESLGCVEDFLGCFDLYGVDTIDVFYSGVKETYEVKNIEESKHTPYKVTFVNKFGVLQDLWFFKRSNLSMNTQKESYKKSMVSGGTYSINRGQDTVFNKNATQTLSLNTGFYPEEYNEVFRQLYLSENIWIGFEGKTLPVTIKSQSFNYKTRLNDKLINYTIDIEFGFDKINNIR